MTQVARRGVLAGLGSAGLIALTAACGASGTRPPADDAGPRLGALERRSGGRLGVALLDGRDDHVAGHRIDERFTMCSTVKLSVAAAVLARIDMGDYRAGDRLLITRADPVGHSPAVRAAIEAGQGEMNILDLCRAAQVESDNGATNILIRKLGGPAAMTAYWRALGDPVTRLDRYEPELNLSHGDDHRDTTSPAAMARSMRAILTGGALKPESRERLIGWTVETRTGLRRLRAGLPADWRAGDKTGSMWGDPAFGDKYNDIAVVWHPGRAEPFFVAAYLESAVKGSEAMRPQDEAVLAQAGAIAAEWIAARV